MFIKIIQYSIEELLIHIHFIKYLAHKVIEISIYI